MRKFLLPPADGPLLGKVALVALASALLAGGFGIVHDQITYTISPEYFTNMKFDQFRGADFGLPPRLFVAEIGFLATWWVGLIGGWFLARVTLPKFESPGMIAVASIFAILGFSIACAILGDFFGPDLLGNRPGWADALASFGVTDSVAFNRVAGIHLGSYIGSFFGWIAMMVYLMKSRGDR